jgi:hypothetical protein
LVGITQTVLTITGAPLYDMGRTLFNLYTQPLGGGAEDFRRWCFVDRSAAISFTSWLLERACRDYRDCQYQVKQVMANDLKVFRLSEIFFIKQMFDFRAEGLNGPTGAADP